MKNLIKIPGYFTFCTFLFLWNLSLNAQTITSHEVDSLVEATLKIYNVPGIAVGIVKDNKVILAKGYGVSSLNTKKPVDSGTLFGIASNTKAFTTAALGILVDEKKLSWDDKVIDYIPEFRLYDPYVTSEFTIRDLLTHRSGLGLGAGDLMFWPGINDFTLNDVIHNLRYLKPVSGFRTKYDYDNLLYIIAGEVIARVSGMHWEDFIESRILKPLNMNASAAAYDRLKDKSNVTDPHAFVDGKVMVVDRDINDLVNAAGGIYSNIDDMCKWLMMQLNNGIYGEGRLFSREVQKTMWSPQTIINVEDSTAYNTHFSSYGLGWFLSDVKGYKQVGHTGGLAGIVTQVTLIPELKLGIIVLTNQSSNSIRAVTYSIEDHYLGIKGIDRIKQFHQQFQNGIQDAQRFTDNIRTNIETQDENSKKINKSIYTGTFSDKWFGEISISVKNGKLWFDSKRSGKLTGEMQYYKGNTFVVKWVDRSLDADAFVIFALDNNGKASEIRMKAISPMTDFSFDFQDLDFNRK
jgi:CubicO group peptidase (beta-lactamase class C family)